MLNRGTRFKGITGKGKMLVRFLCKRRINTVNSVQNDQTIKWHLRDHESTLVIEDMIWKLILIQFYCHY